MTGAPNLFGVVSWGRSGTVWLAKMLNAHPEVLCFHHLRASLTAGDPTHAGALSDVEYLRVIERQAASYRLAGDCHGLHGNNLQALQDAFGSRFRPCVLTRHPVPRIDSYLAFAKNVGYGFYNMDRVGLLESLGADLRAVVQDDEERLFFVFVMAMVNSVIYEANWGPIFTLERLSGGTQALDELLGYLSQGELQYPAEWLESVFAQRLNARPPEHLAGPVPEPSALYGAWAGWKRRLFAELLDPHARTLYEQHGLPLHWCEEVGAT